VFSDVLPLRAMLFQVLFMLLAIALDAAVFQRLLRQDYKTSTQSAVTINLFSTVAGWTVFFILQPLLPNGLKIQLMSYVFFNRFLGEPWLPSVAPLLVWISLCIFIGTFFVKWKALDWMEIILQFGQGKKQDQAPETIIKPPRFRAKRGQNIGFQVDSKPYAVLVGNACSFSVILLILFIRFVWQTG